VKIDFYNNTIILFLCQLILQDAQPSLLIFSVVASVPKALSLLYGGLKSVCAVCPVAYATLVVEQQAAASTQSFEFFSKPNPSI
jgi:hypothetical protein